MLPTLPKVWKYGEKLPFYESSTVEFKEVTVFSGLFRDKSLGKTGLTKYRETLIGFLNSGIGYLLMGIKDDATIVGVENVTCEKIDMLQLWLDSSYHGLVYTDGKPLDPSEISLKLHTFPLENYISCVIVIEAINKGKLFNIMTCSGTMIHRLNASNLKITAEPVYRKRDVKGMICSMQEQMRREIADKKRAIRILEERHCEEIKQILQAERNSVREYIEKISCSLYEKYKRDGNEITPILRFIKYLLCIK